MKRQSLGLLIGVPSLSLGLFLAQPKPTFQKSVAPVVNQYCVPCHSGKQPSAGLDLAAALKRADITTDAALWKNVSENVSSGHMPPPGQPRPSATAKKQLLEALRALAAQTPNSNDPGRVTMRRLNRAEYDNTIRDLTGLDLHLSKDFPSDDVGYGFDNIGDVLSMSSLLFEKYLDAAEKVANTAIVVNQVNRSVVSGADLIDGSASSTTDDSEKILYSNCIVVGKIKVKQAGAYRVKVNAYGQLAGPDAPKMSVSVNNESKTEFNVSNKVVAGFEIPVRLAKGENEVKIGFENDYYDERTKADRNLIVRSLELIGPLDGISQKPESHRKIIQRDPEKGEWDSAAKSDIKRFASKAFRRPITSDEQVKLKAVFDTGAKLGSSYQEGMRAVVMATLVSPQFLFRVETNTIGKSRPLNDYEVASRLSYFLWSSMPDQELTSLADDGKLKDPAVLSQQVTRMLADPKSDALANNFAEQWLELRKLEIFEPDRKQFPEFSEQTRSDMATETKLFFNRVLRENRSVVDFLAGRYTYVNGNLAKLYGIPGISGNEFQKIALNDENRGGILTQASVLSVTSNPTRTSPTKRGKWVLEEILGTPPPPPPPGVGTIAEERSKLTATTLRKLMEEHRKNPACASCHARMDPIGFGLENFDAIGRWRTKEGEFSVDSSGVLPDGRNFSGPKELRDILLTNKQGFVRALSEKLLTYALGRGTTYADKKAIELIATKTEKSDYRFQSMIEAIVTSDPFMKQGVSK